MARTPCKLTLLWGRVRALSHRKRKSGAVTTSTHAEGYVLTYVPRRPPPPDPTPRQPRWPYGGPSTAERAIAHMYRFGPNPGPPGKPRGYRRSGSTSVRRPRPGS
jgi:hypothetical protein